MPQLAAAIVTLADNTVQQLGLPAEHGLSIWIQTPAGDILFDTGQNLAVTANTRSLHVDLKNISGIALSHGQWVLWQMFGAAFIANSVGDRIECGN
jgi:metal-dependent hydrolase (beta-lactamase superfamily II)